MKRLLSPQLVAWHDCSMTDRRTKWLVSCFAAGLLLTGIPYWRLPYNANIFVDPAMLIGMVGLGIVTALLTSSGLAGLARAFWTMLAVFPAAVALRVVIETAQDPTDHNLWPFELVIAAIFSLVAVVPGLLVGLMLRRIKT